jgi:hypothetical protein
MCLSDNFNEWRVDWAKPHTKIYKTFINNWNYAACYILTSLPVSDFDYEGVCHLHVHIYKHGNGEKPMAGGNYSQKLTNK